MDPVKVAIRVRPLSSREIKAGLKSEWVCTDTSISSRVGSSCSQYVFDSVYNEECTNTTIYNELVSDIVKKAMEGFHGTLFTYGQSGSGKTYTIDALRTLSIKSIYKYIENCPSREFLMRVSYMELYNEKLMDLLADEATTLTIREDLERNVYIEGLKEEIILSQDHVHQVLAKGNEKRSFAETKQNDRSSRAHCIFRIVIESREREDPEHSSVYLSHLNLVDLAGNEKAGENVGDRLKEGCSINRSLLSLSLVIRKLSEEQSNVYINYRDSKLTRILQNALEGNSKTCILCTVSPGFTEETHSSLRFALSAKMVKTKPQQNEVLTERAMLKKSQLEIEQLKSYIKEIEQGITYPPSQQDFSISSQEREELEQMRLKQERLMEQLSRLLCVSSKVAKEKQGFNKKRRETVCVPQMNRIAGIKDLSSLRIPTFIPKQLEPAVPFQKCQPSQMSISMSQFGSYLSSEIHHSLESPCESQNCRCHNTSFTEFEKIFVQESVVQKYQNQLKQLTRNNQQLTRNNQQLTKKVHHYEQLLFVTNRSDCVTQLNDSTGPEFICPAFQIGEGECELEEKSVDMTDVFGYSDSLLEYQLEVAKDGSSLLKPRKSAKDTCQISESNADLASHRSVHRQSLWHSMGDDWQDYGFLKTKPSKISDTIQEEDDDIYADERKTDEIKESPSLYQNRMLNTEKGTHESAEEENSFHVEKSQVLTHSDSDRFEHWQLLSEQAALKSLKEELQKEMVKLEEEKNRLAEEKNAFLVERYEILREKALKQDCDSGKHEDWQGSDTRTVYESREIRCVKEQLLLEQSALEMKKEELQEKITKLEEERNGLFDKKNAEYIALEIVKEELQEEITQLKEKNRLAEEKETFHIEKSEMLLSERTAMEIMKEELQKEMAKLEKERSEFAQEKNAFLLEKSNRLQETAEKQDCDNGKFVCWQGSDVTTYGNQESDLLLSEQTALEMKKQLQKEMARLEEERNAFLLEKSALEIEKEEIEIRKEMTKLAEERNTLAEEKNAFPVKKSETLTDKVGNEHCDPDDWCKTAYEVKEIQCLREQLLLEQTDLEMKKEEFQKDMEKLEESRNRLIQEKTANEVRKEELQKVTEELDELRKRLAEEETAMEVRKEELHKVMAKSDEARNRLAEEETAMEVRKEELLKIMTKSEEAKNRLAEEETAMEVRKEELLKIMTKLDEARNRLAEEETAMEVEREQHQKEIAQLEIERNRLIEEKKNILTGSSESVRLGHFQGTDEVIYIPQGEHNGLEKEKDEWVKERRSRQLDTDLHARIEALDQSLNVTEPNMSENESSHHSSVKQQGMELASNTSSREECSQGPDSSWSQLQEELEVKEYELEQAEEKIQNLQNVISKGKELLKQKNESISEGKNQIQKLQNDMTTLQSKIATMEAGLKTSECDQLRQIERAAHADKRKVAELHKQLEEVQCGRKGDEEYYQEVIRKLKLKLRNTQEEEASFMEQKKIVSDQEKRLLEQQLRRTLEFENAAKSLELKHLRKTVEEQKVTMEQLQNELYKTNQSNNWGQQERANQGSNLRLDTKSTQTSQLNDDFNSMPSHQTEDEWIKERSSRQLDTDLHVKRDALDQELTLNMAESNMSENESSHHSSVKQQGMELDSNMSSPDPDSSWSQLQEELEVKEYELEQAEEKIQNLQNVISKGKELLKQKNESISEGKNQIQKLQNDMTTLQSKIATMEAGLKTSECDQLRQIERAAHADKRKVAELHKQLEEVQCGRKGDEEYYQEVIRKLKLKLRNTQEEEASFMEQKKIVSDQEKRLLEQQLRRTLEFENAAKSLELKHLRKTLEEQKNICQGSRLRFDTKSTQTSQLNDDFNSMPSLSSHRTGGAVESFIIAKQEREIRVLRRQLDKLMDKPQQSETELHLPLRDTNTHIPHQSCNQNEIVPKGRVNGSLHQPAQDKENQHPRLG